jgi:hypothetical protein
VKLRFLLTTAASVALLAGGAGQAIAAPAGPAAASSGGGAQTARAVNVRALAGGRQLPIHAWNRGALGKDGQPAGSGLPAGSIGSHKPVPARTPVRHRSGRRSAWPHPGRTA